MTPTFKKALVKCVRQNIKRQQEALRMFVQEQDRDDTANLYLQDAAIAAGNVAWATNETYDWAKEFGLQEEYELGMGE